MPAFLLLTSFPHSQRPPSSCMRCSFFGWCWMPSCPAPALFFVVCTSHGWTGESLLKFFPGPLLDTVGELARTPLRNRAIPRPVPAPLSGQPCV